MANTTYNRIKRTPRLTAFFVPAFVLAFALASTALVGDETKQEKPMLPFKQLLSEDIKTADRAVDTILKDRKSTIEQLIPMIDPANSKKYSDFTRPRRGIPSGGVPRRGSHTGSVEGARQPSGKEKRSTC